MFTLAINATTAIMTQILIFLQNLHLLNFHNNCGKQLESDKFNQKSLSTDFTVLCCL